MRDRMDAKGLHITSSGDTSGESTPYHPEITIIYGISNGENEG